MKKKLTAITHVVLEIIKHESDDGYKITCNGVDRGHLHPLNYRFLDGVVWLLDNNQTGEYTLHNTIDKALIALVTSELSILSTPLVIMDIDKAVNLPANTEGEEDTEEDTEGDS